MNIWGKISDWSWEMSVGVIGVLAVEVIEWVSNSNSFSILENLSISLIWAPLQIRRVVS
jgi:hypothetical protein